jgi:hypothetical protein
MPSGGQKATGKALAFNSTVADQPGDAPVSTGSSVSEPRHASRLDGVLEAVRAA